MTKYRVFLTGETRVPPPPPPKRKILLLHPPPSILPGKILTSRLPPSTKFLFPSHQKSIPSAPPHLMKIFKLQPNKNTTFNCSHCSCTGIKIANGHRTLSGKNCDMSSTHVSKQDILSCTLLLSIICEKSFKLKLV